MNDFTNNPTPSGEHGLERAEALLRQIYSDKSLNALPYTHHFVGVALEALQEERESLRAS